jgi:hypothetical protein
MHITCKNNIELTFGMGIMKYKLLGLPFRIIRSGVYEIGLHKKSFYGYE